MCCRLLGLMTSTQFPSRNRPRKFSNGRGRGHNARRNRAPLAAHIVYGYASVVCPVEVLQEFETVSVGVEPHGFPFVRQDREFAAHAVVFGKLVVPEIKQLPLYRRNTISSGGARVRAQGGNEVSSTAFQSTHATPELYPRPRRTPRCGGPSRLRTFQAVKWFVRFMSHTFVRRQGS